MRRKVLNHDNNNNVGDDQSKKTVTTTARNVAAGLLMRQRFNDNDNGNDEERFRHQLSFRCFGIHISNNNSSNESSHDTRSFATYSEMIDIARRVGFATCDAMMRVELTRSADSLPSELITVCCSHRRTKKRKIGFNFFAVFSVGKKAVGAKVASSKSMGSY